MSDREPHFAEYGAGGDALGARRSRRGLQLTVFSLVIVSVGLFYSEQFLRHEHVENLYTSALTKHDASARPILRAAVLQDAESERPNPKYIWALAEREEEDRILETYARAFALNPRNPQLATRYGVRLFLEEQFGEARDRFHDAVVADIENALPSYLEAAAIAASDDRRESLEQALALVARVNGSGNAVQFPKPLWIQDLPRRGNVHAHLQRRVIEECLAPLLDLTLRVRERVEEDLLEGRGLAWATGLNALEEMGRRLALGAPPGGLQAIRGASIQLEAIRLQERLAQLDSGRANQEILSRRLRIEEQVRPVLLAFEDTRDARIEASVRAYSIPLQMTFELLLYMSLALFAGFLWALPQRGVKAFWTISLGRTAVIAVASGIGGVLLFYLVMALLAGLGVSPEWWGRPTAFLWRLLAGVLVGFSVLYPAFRLPAAAVVARSGDSSGTPDDLLLSQARRERRRAHAVMTYRLLGLVLGGMVVAVCVWGIGHRVVASYYPHQVEVLATGLEQEEAAMMERIRGYLEQSGRGDRDSG